MDIKPVKKRRQKAPAQKQPEAAGSRQNNIEVKPNSNWAHPVSKNLKTKNKKLRDFLKRNVFLIATFSLLCALYLPASININTTEQHQGLINKSLSLDSILNEVSYMPQKLFLMFTDLTALGSSFALKAYSFIFIVLVVFLFYFVCLKWFGEKVAAITTLLFASSSWMILSSQSLSFNNLYLAFVPLVIFLSYSLIKNKSLLVFASTLLLSAILYSPGMVWPVLGMIVLLPLFMQTIINKYNIRDIWIFFVTTLVAVAPLLVTLAFRPANFSYILAGEGEINLQVLTQNLQTSLEVMFFSGLPNANLWLVGTPVFNYLTTLLFIFGLVFLITNKQVKQQLNFLLMSLVFSLLAITFVGLTALSLIIPAVYLTAGFGIKLLLNNWYAIFPTNPVARNLGLSLVIVVVLLAAGYNITRYYIAWPKSQQNIHVLNSKQYSGKIET